MNEPLPYAVVHTLTDPQIEQLHALYQGEWWSVGRSIEDVRIMLRHSDFSFGLISPDSPERLLAFARVLTDCVFKAFVFDVIVHPDHRSAGLGSYLMTAITSHPVLSHVRHIELYCLPERADFYRRAGFTSELDQFLLLRRTREDPV